MLVVPGSPARHLAPMPARRAAPRSVVVLDRALERLPLFRLSDSAADEGALQYAPAPGARWRVLPAPGDRLPGTFDQDVYVGLLHRWTETGRPDDGVVTFTLHALLRALGRKADGRTYAQLRHALTRLERTTLEASAGAYASAGLDGAGAVAGAGGGRGAARFSVLSSVVIERRRVAPRAASSSRSSPSSTATTRATRAWCSPRRCAPTSPPGA
jgi:hypothetical protein